MGVGIVLLMMGADKEKVRQVLQINIKTFITNISPTVSLSF